MRFNGPLVVLVWLGAIALAWARRDNWLVGACWGFFAVLLTYKVGNQQFWVSWLALVAALPLLNRPDADRLARLSWPFAIFLSLFTIGYVVLQPQYYQGQLAVGERRSRRPCVRARRLDAAELVQAFASPISLTRSRAACSSGSV